MSVLSDAPGLLQALSGEMTPKFLATRSAEGTPNVVPCITLLPAGDVPDVLTFGNFLLRKSIKNLEQDRRVGILVITTDLRGWILTGDFLEFQRSGPYVDRQMSSSLLRYNAYTGIRNAGVIRARSVDASFAIPRLVVLRDFVLARLSALRGWGRGEGGVTVPLPVRIEFGKLMAVKVLAWVGSQGYPVIVPATSMQPAGPANLVCWNGMPSLPQPPSGASVATNTLSLEAVSYQAKGTWSVSGHAGAIQVREVYAGGPPLPGGRVA